MSFLLCCNAYIIFKCLRIKYITYIHSNIFATSFDKEKLFQCNISVTKESCVLSLVINY